MTVAPQDRFARPAKEPDKQVRNWKFAIAWRSDYAGKLGTPAPRFLLLSSFRQSRLR
jgi:hypothetical protein